MQEVLVRNSIGEAKMMEDRYTPDVMNESRDSCFTSNDREHRKGNNVDDAVASIFARKSSIASSRKVSIMDSVEALTREVQEIERQISRQQGNAFNAGDEGTLMMLHSKPSSLSAKSSPEDLPFEVRPYLLSGLGGARERLPLSEEEDNQEVDAAVNSINANKRTVDVYSRRPADTMRSLPKDQEKKHDEFRRDLTTEDPTNVHPRAFSALREGISSQTKSLQRRTGIERFRTHTGKLDDDRSSLGDANAQEQKPHTRSGSRPKIGCSGVRKQGETMKTNADRQTGIPASKDILPRMCSHHTSTPLSSHKISTFAENSPMLEMQPYVLSSQATPTPRKAPGGRSATPTPHKKILPHVAQHSKPWGANPSQSPAQQAASNRRSSSPAVQCGLKDSTITRAGSHLLLVGKGGKNNSSPSLQNSNNGVTPLSKQTPRVTRGMGTAQIRSASTSSIRGTMQPNPTRTHREPAIGTSRAERGRTPRSKVPENHRPILSNNGPSMPETSITTKNENKRLTKDSETRESNEPLMYRHDEPAGLILHGSHHAKISSGAPSATLARQYSSSPELDASEDLEALVSKKLVERIKMRPDHSGSCAHVETVPTLPRPGPEDRESLPFHPNTEGAGDIGTSIPTLQARIFHLEGEVHCLRTSHDTLTHQYHEYRAQTDHRMTQLQTQLEAALQWIRQVDDYASAFGNGGADTKDASVPKEFETAGGLFTTFMDGASGALSRGRSPPHFRNYTPPQSTVEDFGAITGTPTRRLDLTDESTGVESLSNLPSAAYSKSGEIRTSVVTYTEHEQNMDQTSDCYYDILSATRQRADAHQPGEFQIESPPILPLEMRPQSLSEKKRNVAPARNSS